MEGKRRWNTSKEKRELGEQTQEGRGGAANSEGAKPGIKARRGDLFPASWMRTEE